MRSERERMLDILEAIGRIEKYTDDGKSAFEGDELIQTWMVHHIKKSNSHQEVADDDG